MIAPISFWERWPLLCERDWDFFVRTLDSFADGHARRDDDCDYGNRTVEKWLAGNLTKAQLRGLRQERKQDLQGVISF